MDCSFILTTAEHLEGSIDQTSCKDPVAVVPDIGSSEMDRLIDNEYVAVDLIPQFERNAEERRSRHGDHHHATRATVARSFRGV